MNDASVTLQDVAVVERIIRRRLATGSAALSAVATQRNNDKAPRDNRKIRKTGEGGTCTHHGRFVAHKPSECRYKPNAPSVVAATAAALSVDEKRAACAADTSAAIQEAFKALLTAQATSGKDANSDYPLSPSIIFDSGATATMLRYDEISKRRNTARQTCIVDTCRPRRHIPHLPRSSRHRRPHGAITTQGRYLTSGSLPAPATS
jgi:hypothetical protein